jgi:hypothetical protein
VFIPVKHHNSLIHWVRLIIILILVLFLFCTFRCDLSYSEKIMSDSDRGPTGTRKKGVLVLVLLIAVLLVAQSLEEAEDSSRDSRQIQKTKMNNLGNQPKFRLLRSQREPEASPLRVVCLRNPHKLQLEVFLYNYSKVILVR